VGEGTTYLKDWRFASGKAAGNRDVLRSIGARLIADKRISGSESALPVLARLTKVT
jgi:hypothetical protein